MGGRRLRPAKWSLLEKCGPQCSLNPSKFTKTQWDIIFGWFEAGWNDDRISEGATEIGLTLNPSSIGRHRSNHMRMLEEVAFDKARPTEGEELSDLDALEAILKQGSRQIQNWKITPSDFFKALDAKYKLTQGSAFDSFMEALAVAEDELEGYEEELSVDEDVEGPGAVREVLPEQSAASGPVEVAEELPVTD